MKVAGDHRLAVSRPQVFGALQDPAVLARTLPGCDRLEVVGPGSYAATLTAGVASVKGTYRGQVSLAEQDAPRSYRLRAEGAGAPGTVRADVLVTLEEDGDGTIVSYQADAVVGGMIGGVGQRMLVGVAEKTAAEFFTAVERELTAAPHLESVTATVGEPRRDDVAEAVVGQTFHARAAGPSRAGARVPELLAAALVGAGIALAGVLVGRRLARREQG